MGKFGRLSPPVAAVVSALVLAGCAGGGSMELVRTSPQPEPRGSAAAGAGNPGHHPRLRDRRPLGLCRLSPAGGSRPHRDRRPRPVPPGRRHQSGSDRRRDDVSRRPVRVAGAAAQGRPERPQLHRSGRRARRRSAGPRDRQLRRPHHGAAFANPEIDGRYGTGIYVRCAPSAGGVAQTRRRSNGASARSSVEPRRQAPRSDRPA